MNFETMVVVDEDTVDVWKPEAFNKLSFNEKAFSRNIGLLSLAEQEKLAGTRVAIAGMGGGRRSSFNYLAQNRALQI